MLMPVSIDKLGLNEYLAICVSMFECQFHFIKLIPRQNVQLYVLSNCFSVSSFVKPFFI
jgi:hypothetical protein